VADISDPYAPVQVASLSIPGLACGIALRDTLAFIAAGTEGLQVVDVSDPTAPVLIGGLNTPGFAQQVELVEDYAVIAARDTGVQVINIENPTAPYMYIVGKCDTLADARQMDVVGNRIYIADRNQLVIGDLSFYSGGYTLGDIDNSGEITSADVIRLVNFVFRGGPPPQPVRRSGDINCDGPVTAPDIILLVNYVFKGGAEPACP
jgi:hypothetical protein